tara:strand:+ start:50 stop:538 length:489 start_codon:yes stop_codon:yes gene_type:complete
MNEEIKNQMLLNSESYEFFLMKTREKEKVFFAKAELCGKEMERVTQEVEKKGFKPNTAQYDLSISRRINLNIFSAALSEGKSYMTIAGKFLTELNMMKDLSSNIVDEDLNFEDSLEREEFLESYKDSIDKAINMQEKVTFLISSEMKMLESISKSIDTQKGE